MIHVLHSTTPEQIILTLSTESYHGFYIALQRALNCWPDAPQELMDLSDAMEEHLGMGQPKT